MATSLAAGVLGIPKDFSPFERSLIGKTDQAISDGIQLYNWTRDPNRKIEEHLLTLGRKYDLPNKAYGYLCEPEISGKKLPALGARQEVEFGKMTGPNPEERLKEYVLRYFMKTS